MSKSGTASSTTVGFVTVEDLRSGRVAQVNPRTFSRLSGRGVYSLDRDRWLGKGTRFSKDGNGRIWYAAGDVLACIDNPRHRSTCEYDTSKNLAALSVARQVQRTKSGGATP